MSGCLRYVPSQEELNAQAGAPDKNNMLGAQEFSKYESKLQTRLEDLLRERAYLLNQNTEDSEYHVGSGDVLQLDVFGFNDLKTETTVGPNGVVSLPLVGDLSVGGHAITEVRNEVSRQYARYIRNPKTQLTVKTYQANRVSVNGEVSRPGIYPLRHNGQLITELLSEAGGRTEKASSRVLLLPAVKVPATVASLEPSAAPPQVTTGTAVEVDLERLFGGADQRPLLVPLLPGDTIIVPESGNFEVDGEVNQPGSFKLGGRTSVMGAIAAASGFTYSADVNKVEVIRDVGQGKKALVTLDLEEAALRGGQDLRLRDGDIIRVPSESGRFFRRQIVEAINGVFRGVGVSGKVN